MPLMMCIVFLHYMCAKKKLHCMSRKILIQIKFEIKGFWGFGVYKLLIELIVNLKID